MSYIGRQGVIGNFVKLDSITAVNGQAAYTMQNGSVNFTDYSTVNQFLVSLNGTIQSPGSSFTVSGSTLTFASNLSTGDVIDFIIVFGNSLSAGTPTDGTVTAAKINNDIISGSTELATEPADTDEFLVSDAGTLKRIDYSLIKGGGITQADQWRLTANITGTNALISSNLSQVSGAVVGTGMSVSSGIFTFPETGVYLVIVNLEWQLIENSDNVFIAGLLTTDNSSYSNFVRPGFSNKMGSNTADGITSSQFGFVDITNTSTHKVKFETQSMAGSTIFAGDANSNKTTFSFIRLGDT